MVLLERAFQRTHHCQLSNIHHPDTATKKEQLAKYGYLMWSKFSKACTYAYSVLR